MEFLNNIFGYVAAFFSGFIGHLVAHDVCEVTPMMCRRLIDFAASRLPKSVRARYAEEWRADLSDQPGSIAKLKWALGCLWCVHKIRHTVSVDRMRRTTFEFSFAPDKVMVCDIPTARAFSLSLRVMARLMRLPTWCPKSVRSLAVLVLTSPPKFAILEWRTRHCGKPDYGVVAQLIHEVDPKKGFRFKRLVDGVVESTYEPGAANPK